MIPGTANMRIRTIDASLRCTGGDPAANEMLPGMSERSSAGQKWRVRNVRNCTFGRSAAVIVPAGFTHPLVNGNCKQWLPRKRLSRSGSRD